RELAHHLAGELVDIEEALQQQRDQRAEIDDAEPQYRRHQQDGEEQPAMAIEERRDSPSRRRARQGQGDGSHCPPSASRLFCRRCQMIGALWPTSISPVGNPSLFWRMTLSSVSSPISIR